MTASEIEWEHIGRSKGNKLLLSSMCVESMLYSVGLHAIETRKWETESQMLEYLGQFDPKFILLNKEPEYKADFYSVIVHLNYFARTSSQKPKETHLGIGLHSEIVGIMPHLLWLPPEEIIIGFDCSVAGIKINKREISFRIDFDTPFRSFLLLDSPKVLLVFNEIGVVSLGENGSELWRYEKDVITDCVIESNIMTLSFLDSPSVRIDLLNGSRVDRA